MDRDSEARDRRRAVARKILDVEAANPGAVGVIFRGLLKSVRPTSEEEVDALLANARRLATQPGG